MTTDVAPRAPPRARVRAAGPLPAPALAATPPTAIRAQLAEAAGFAAGRRRRTSTSCGAGVTAELRRAGRARARRTSTARAARALADRARDPRDRRVGARAPARRSRTASSSTRRSSSPRRYGGTDGHKFVNGVLDKLAADAARGRDRRARGASAGARAAMRRRAAPAALLAASRCVASAALRRAARSLVVYCSHDPDACELAAQTFTRDTGIADVRSRASRPASSTRRSAPSATTRRPTSGTAARSIRSCRARPRGCSPPYRSPRLAELHPWARRQAERSPATASSAIYRIIIGFGTNPALLAQARRCRRRAAGRTSSKPEYRREIELSNPVTSGTGYTILATLVALYGEDGAFAYLKRLAPNVVRYTQSGTAQGPSVARGEVGVGVTFVHEFVTQQLAGLRRRHRDSLRGHRRRAGRHGDRRRRAASGRGARVLRLGADRAARRSSPTARAT